MPDETSGFQIKSQISTVLCHLSDSKIGERFLPFSDVRSDGTFDWLI